MAGITIYEFDALVAAAPGVPDVGGQRVVPPRVFNWLELQTLRAAKAGASAWLRLTQRRGRRAVQVTSFVGVIRSPDGFQIEVLPKVGKAIGGGDAQARRLLIEMLRCLGGFRHVQTDSAKLVATRMPLLEVFIGEFLLAVEHIVKQGLRSDYAAQRDNVFALRGKLQIASHLRQNLCRRDRFFAEFDEFSTNRPENRLLHAALRRTLAWTASQANQQLARARTSTAWTKATSINCTPMAKATSMARATWCWSIPERMPSTRRCPCSPSRSPAACGCGCCRSAWLIARSSCLLAAASTLCLHATDRSWRGRARHRTDQLLHTGWH